MFVSHSLGGGETFRWLHYWLWKVCGQSGRAPDWHETIKVSEEMFFIGTFKKRSHHIQLWMPSTLFHVLYVLFPPHQTPGALAQQRPTFLLSECHQTHWRCGLLHQWAPGRENIWKPRCSWGGFRCHITGSSLQGWYNFIEPCNVVTIVHSVSYDQNMHWTFGGFR